MNSIKTKIICTIGPSVSSLKKILDLIKAGMNVARLNFSHGTYEEHLAVINTLKEAREKSARPLAIMLDTKGAEIRIGRLKNEGIFLQRDQELDLVTENVIGDEKKIQLTPANIFKNVKRDMQIFFNDGLISAKVLSATSKKISIQIENSGELISGKGVNIPGTFLKSPALTPQDIEDIKFGCQHGIDIIAASFVRSAQHLLSIRKLIHKEGKKSILLIAKIENHQGVEDIDSIVQISDGIMIARGDLGVEFKISQVPKLQKMIIKKCLMACKPSVTATQMLESMLYHPRPTRAEASDVANAIYDSTSAVMLSGETAIGKHPIEAVKIMKNIIQETENDFNYEEFFFKDLKPTFHTVPSSIAASTVKTAYSTNAKAIFVFTSSGQTARLISRLRPSIPIIALTSNRKTYNQLAFNWGVFPIYGETCHSVEDAFNIARDVSLQKGYVNYGDIVVITAGTPFDTVGTTNMMIVENIGNVLLRCHAGYGDIVYGKATILLSTEKISPEQVTDSIAIILKCNKSYVPILKNCKGVVLQNLENDKESEECVKKLHTKFKIPVLIRADAACSTIKEGQLITIEPEKALIYNGIIEK